MSSSSKKARRASTRTSNSNVIELNESFQSVKPMTYAQGEYLEAIRSCDITFGIGSAGTGKTFVAAMYAAEQLFRRKVDKVILTRPNIETGKGLGFLPGELDEKYAPYLQPFEGVFSKALGEGFYSYALRKKDIDPKPLGFMRGSSFEDCIILVDECQNMTKTVFKMLLTRIGKNCKVILSGDPQQTDIRDSGLLDAVGRLESVKSVGVVRFLDEDIVRSETCKRVILAYNN